MGRCEIWLISSLALPYSGKYGIDGVGIDTTNTADTLTSVHKDLYVSHIAPGGVPRVLDKPVVQASGFIIAITDYEYGMVEWVQITCCEAVCSIYDTVCVGMYVYIIGRNSDRKRLSLKQCFLFGKVTDKIIIFFDFDVGCLLGRV